MTHPHHPARIESVLSHADVHLLLTLAVIVLAVICVAACAVPVLDAVRRWVAR